MRIDARGFTMVEMVVGMAISITICLAFASLLKHVTRSTVNLKFQGQSQEDARQALMKMEEALLHANEIKVASSTFVEFISDIDQSPSYDPNGDLTGGGIPNFRNADRGGNAGLLMSATAQWRAGFNLQNDDENFDGKIDVLRRLSLSSQTLWLDMSLDEAPWGGAYLHKVALNVSSFTLTYWGNKANKLGKNVDLDADGIISQDEMDRALPGAGMGNNNGVLDLKDERRYITAVRVHLAIDSNHDNRTDYAVDTDVYPPLLPLKSR